MKGIFHIISMRGPIKYLIVSILVTEIGWNGLRIEFLMNVEVGHFMAHVIKFKRDRLPTRFKSGFQ